MWGYQRRLGRDIERWQSQGLVTADQGARMLADAARHGRDVSLPTVLGILASVLFGFAVISFVAAHWNEMPRLARLGLLMGLLWAGYVAAGVLADRGGRAFADAAVLFSTAVFGASIMLISQMFHIDGNPPDGVLLWWIGALVAGAVLRSNPALALALVLVCLWAGMETSARVTVYWPFLIGWGLVTMAFIWQRWRPGLHLSALALTGFIISLGYLLNRGHEHHLVAGLGLVGCAAAFLIDQVRPQWADLKPPLLGYAMVIAFAGLFALQFVDSVSNANLLALAAFTLLGLIGAIAYGLAHGAKGPLWIGYTAFSIEILALYWKTVGSILDTSLFFLVAGLIVAALAAMAWRLAQRNTAQGAPA
jgi:uncharacterized membrane protein